MFRLSRALPRTLSRVPVSARRDAIARPSVIRHGQLIQSALLSSKPPKEDVSPAYTQRIDREGERKVAHEKLESRPSEVSTESSVRHIIEPSPASPSKAQAKGDGVADLKHDLNIIKDTVALEEVPRESHILGLAGTVPYLGTSVGTVFLAWDLNKELPTGNAFYDAIFINHETARHLLSMIEPLQLGYGAVIISFLGAIHWGLEYAEKKPQYERTRFRYGMGLAASIVAWPTLLMSVEYALTAQFAAFVALYFADSRAAKRGWAPYWYGTYRFLLTAIVGLSIFVSLVGRAKINQGDAITGQGLRKNITQAGIADHTTNWAKLEKEEKERLRKQEAEKKRQDRREQQKKEAEEKGQPSEKSDEKSSKDEESASKDNGGENKQERSDSKTGDDKASGKGARNDSGDEKGNEAK